MSESTGKERMLRFLDLAIHREQSAHELYTGLQKLIKNPGARDMFGRLAEDEMGHRIKLEQWYTRLSGGSAFEMDRSKIESWNVQLDERTDALDALRIAIEAEQRDGDFYRAKAAETKDQDLAILLVRLAEEEDGHYQTLQAEKNAVTDNYYWLDIERVGLMED